MLRPTLVHGMVLAATLSLAAPVLDRAARVFLPPGPATRVALAMLVGAYLLHLFRLNRARIGNATLGATAALALLGALLFGVTTASLVLIAVVLIWAVRSACAYASLLMALADAGLCLLGLGGGAWALDATGSFYCGIWWFLMTQTLWTLIPERPGRSERRHPAVNASSFSQAHALAEAALRRLRVRHDC